MRVLLDECVPRRFGGRIRRGRGQDRRRNKLDFLLPLVPELLNLLPELQPGEVRIVGRKP